MEQEQSAFSEGIAPGGLRDKPQIKLLVCYLLKMLDKSLTRSQINEIFQEYPVANYFEVNEALSELIKNGMIHSDLGEDDEILTITHKAKYEVGVIERSLPKSIREKSVSTALRILSREKIQNECECSVEERDGGYRVSFAIGDVGVELLRLSVFVADFSHVEIVKKNFFDNAAALYSDIISTLTVE